MKNIFNSVILVFFALLITSFSQNKIALIIDDDVNVRLEPSLDSKVLFKLSKFSKVEILKISDNKETIDSAKDYCDYRNFIKIKTIDNKIGWVFGAYIYKVIEFEQNSRGIYNSNGTYNFFGETFKLYFINNNYNEENDATDATYCRHPEIIVLENTIDMTPNFIRLNGNDRGELFAYRGFLCNDSGNFGDVEVDSIKTNQNELIFKYRGSANEGSTFTFDILIFKDKNCNFYGIKKNMVRKYN